MSYRVVVGVIGGFTEYVLLWSAAAMYILGWRS